MNLDNKYFQGLHYYVVTTNRILNNTPEKFITEYCKRYCNKALYMDMDGLVIHLNNVLNEYIIGNKIKNNRIKICLPYVYQQIKLSGLIQYKIKIKGYKGAICSIYNLLYFNSVGNYNSPDIQNMYLSNNDKMQIKHLFLNLRKEKLKEICNE
jgi:hypothetical protein